VSVNRSRAVSVASTRNLTLFYALQDLRKAPRSVKRSEVWIHAAIDLTKAVFVVQFASMRNSPDREDLEQAALLEFHRSAKKLAILTDTLSPDILFRVLYSVAKYSMFRELARLKKGSLLSYGTAQSEDDEGDFPEEEHLMRVALSLSEEDVSDDDAVEPHEVNNSDPMMQEMFLEESFPTAVVKAVDSLNIYALTPWGEAVRFSAFQRLRGRFPSPTLIRSQWKPPDPFFIIQYGEHLARNAILQVPELLKNREMP